VLTWAEFAAARPELAAAGRELFYYFADVGLGFLATTRRDGGPRVHPICPMLLSDHLLAFIIPSPKLNDLERDGRYALHTYPLPENEDAFYLTGRALLPADPVLRRLAAEAYVAERGGRMEESDLDGQTVVEFLIETCLLTRTTGHGDPNPQHTIWKA
jgi:hypothetical protein